MTEAYECSVRGKKVPRYAEACPDNNMGACKIGYQRSGWMMCHLCDHHPVKDPKIKLPEKRPLSEQQKTIETQINSKGSDLPC